MNGKLIYFTLKLTLLVSFVECQMPKKPPILALVNDIPYIECDVCQKSAKSLYKSVKAKRAKISPMKLSEDDLLTMIEGTCDPETKYGEWIRHYDVIETGDSLKLQEHTEKGKCREECKTIAKCCEQAVGDVDTDISEVLWKNELNLSKFINKVCHQLSDVCKKKKPMYKPGNRKDFKFKEMTEKDFAAEEMVKNMKGLPGMPGLNMYDPEDLQNMRQEMGLDDKVVDEYKKKYLKGEEEEEDVDNQSKQGEKLEGFDALKGTGKEVFEKLKDIIPDSAMKKEL